MVDLETGPLFFESPRVNLVRGAGPRTNGSTVAAPEEGDKGSMSRKLGDPASCCSCGGRQLLISLGPVMRERELDDVGGCCGRMYGLIVWGPPPSEDTEFWSYPRSVPKFAPSAALL